MTDYVPWLKELAKKGGKGVVKNVDARSLRRVAEDLERCRAGRLRDIDEIAELRGVLRDILAEHDRQPFSYPAMPCIKAARAAFAKAGGR